MSYARCRRSTQRSRRWCRRSLIRCAGFLNAWTDIVATEVNCLISDRRGAGIAGMWLLIVPFEDVIHGPAAWDAGGAAVGFQLL